MSKTVVLLFLFLMVACAGAERRADDLVTVSSLRSASGEIVLRRYAGTGEAVVLVTSPGISPRVFDLPGYGGLAPYLQHAGYDVWVVDWNRAALQGDLEGLTALAAHAIAHVAAQRGSVNILAHGLGGVLVVRGAPHEDVGRYVLLSVPGTLKAPLNPLREFSASRWAAPGSLGQMSAIPGTADRRLIDDLFWSYGISPLSPRKLDFLFEPVSPRLLNELSHALRGERWDDRFYAGLTAIDVPLSVFVGQTDAVAPPWQTFETYRLAGTNQKRYRFFSRANGEAREYGHLSVLVGDKATQEVYPLLLESLAFDGDS